MTLQRYQIKLDLNTLYSISIKEEFIRERINPRIFIKDGSVDIYGSDSESVPSSLNEMYLGYENKNISGIDYFKNTPVFIALNQNSGTTNEIIISGLDVINLGNISIGD